MRTLVSPMLKTKSIHSPIEASDGLRILTSRFRGRGIPKSRYDVWMACLGPSEPLLRQWKAGEIRREEYVRRYKEELFFSQDFDARNQTIKNHGQKFTLRLIKELARRQNVTLLCQCPERELRCHRHVLQKVISSSSL